MLGSTCGLARASYTNPAKRKRDRRSKPQLQQMPSAVNAYLGAAGVQCADDEGSHHERQLCGQRAVITAEVQLGQCPGQVGQTTPIHTLDALAVRVQVVEVRLQQLTADRACSANQQGTIVTQGQPKKKVSG